MRLPLLGALVWCATLIFSPCSFAQAAPSESGLEERLSDHHRLMLGGSLSGSWSNDADMRGQRTFPDWSVDLWPSATYFVIDRVGVGVSGGGGFAKEEWMRSIDWKRYAGGFARVVYDLSLSDRLSLLPTLSTGFLREWTERRFRPGPWVVIGSVQGANVVTGPSSGVEFQEDLWRMLVELPVVLHASSSVAVGIGPTFLFDRFLKPRVEMKLPGQFSLEDPSVTRTSRMRVGVSTWIGASF